MRNYDSRYQPTNCDVDFGSQPAEDKMSLPGEILPRSVDSLPPRKRGDDGTMLAFDLPPSRSDKFKQACLSLARAPVHSVNSPGLKADLGSALRLEWLRTDSLAQQG